MGRTANKHKVLTSQERSARWRAKIKEDSTKHAEYLQREKQRHKRRIDDGKVKSIVQLSNRDQRKQRKVWRENKQNSRAKMKDAQSVPKHSRAKIKDAQSVPKQSEQSEPDVLTPTSSKVQSGRKKVRRDRA